MRVPKITIQGSLEELLKENVEAGQIAVSAGVKRATDSVKSAWRSQILTAGLGGRLARTITNRTYPQGRPSLSAAGYVWSKAPEIIGAHDTGPLIQSADGFYLAIPLPAAGVGRRGARLTPGAWEKQNGLVLRFVYRPSGVSLLVADDARVSKKGLARIKRGKRRRDGILTGAQTIPIFLLVRQVRLTKRLDLDGAVKAAEAALPQLVVSAWKDV